ncbi:SIMPL domain-containing protein [Paenibacillus sp. IHBB 10380]|uniref:SIMPL domain-containing protein n=1 Tax=Paenibacillus sp. IHBB 10380 TaxID=1566358 RepID=UPI0005CFCF55|nr:SIMPL domain-containing protein [Paenibacillus sp. IHBB 10380]AJS60829.1 hypothetical protein UB51_22925 [Paenibacillus sp. IHBB 10380]
MQGLVKKVSSVLVVGALLVGATGLNGSFGLASKAYAAEVGVQRNVVNVVGKGEISVTPDIAYLSIGVNIEADTAQAAQKANAAIMLKLNKLLKDSWAIADKDIKTSQFYVQPNYTYSDKEGQKIKGYTANHVLTVSYRDLSKLGQLLDAASNAGANNINNVQFSVENRDQYETQVIEKAMANAEIKAGSIAKAAKRQLGTVLVVSQGDASNPVVYHEQLSAYKAMDTASGATEVEAGEIKVSTQLSVQYELK